MAIQTLGAATIHGKPVGTEFAGVPIVAFCILANSAPAGYGCPRAATYQIEAAFYTPDIFVEIAQCMKSN
jgi:hypothetical protein